jgi:phytoene synthase
MTAPVSQSITRKSASNLALAFVLLPPEKRRAMAALYAFCREVDDIVDDVAVPLDERRARLAAWRADVTAAFEQRPTRFTVLRELQPFIARYQLPLALFDELLHGVEMDLDIQRYADHAALELYCYRVASVVGLLSIEIFGYRNQACRHYAVALGKALQLTNILRDVRADADRGRIYLPVEALARFQVPPEEILRHEYSARFRALGADLAKRARAYYSQARQTLPPEDRRAMIAAELMGSVYWHLLLTLERQAFNVFSPAPVQLSRSQKLRLIVRTWWQISTNSPIPAYGVA